MQHTYLSEDEEKQGNQLFHRAYCAYSSAKKSGSDEALEEAILLLKSVLEYALPEVSPHLWLSTRIVLNEALHLREQKREQES